MDLRCYLHKFVLHMFLAASGNQGSKHEMFIQELILYRMNYLLFLMNLICVYKNTMLFLLSFG